MLEPEWKACLRERGIDVPAGRFIAYDQRTALEDGGLDGLRAPYVLKAVSSRIAHKTEVGAVRVGISTAADVAAELRAMDERLRRQGLTPVPGFLVEEMVAPGLELLLGVHESTEWGRLLIFGLGGVAVEAMGQVAFRALPLRCGDVADMIAGLPWLAGGLARFGPERSSQVAELVWSIGRSDGLAVDGGVPAWEINPLVVNAVGVFAVDVRGTETPDGGK